MSTEVLAPEFEQTREGIIIKSDASTYSVASTYIFTIPLSMIYIYAIEFLSSLLSKFLVHY